MKLYDIVIIGGGASGMAAAIMAKRTDSSRSVAILEKKEALGRKLAATGNGRCNITNKYCDGISEVADFMHSVGIVLRMEEEGRLYPYSEDGNQVVKAFREKAEALGIDIYTNVAVSDVRKLSDGRFEIRPGFIASKVLIATGGKSYANFGTTGDGYIIARNLGHQVTPLIPGLTGIEVNEDIRMLKGIRAKGVVSLFRGDELVESQKGEIQFREDSISGICVMNLSLKVRRDAEYRLELNLIPDFEEVETDELMTYKTVLKDKILEYLAVSGQNPRKMVLTAKGLKGWSEAQITCGGVELDEVNMLTMESRLVPGIFFSGEVLDLQYQCGGYNLNNAWTTGIRAGVCMAEQ